MRNNSFELIRSETIDTLHITMEEYRHQATGAKHIHIKADDDNNAFLVAFLTVPEDSRGVAHILEHTSLCGSKKYPVRDPFFMMIRRSLNNFMNAFTSSDWTAYPFATQNKKDFDNLLNVYLDATFFPILHELDFAQEGHRIEFKETNNPDSELEFKGVVFNEMKGAMSAPVSQLYHRFSENLYPTTTYHYNSGGEPADIPDLTYQQLIDFHHKHYHPSNAVFMTYGDIPAAEHQRIFESNVLADFKALDINFSVPDEQRFNKPHTVEDGYSIEENEPTEKRSHTVIGWLMGKITNTEMVMEASLASRILLGNSASPLMHILESSDLGVSPSPLCGLDDSSLEMSFSCGLEGCDRDSTAKIEKLILNELTRIGQEGVDLNSQAAALHQLELGRREVGGARFPYGLQMLLTALGPTIHNGDAIATLAIDKILENLREKVKNQDFIRQWVQSNLLDNQHRLTLTLFPDPTLAQKQRQAESDKLLAIKSALSDADKQQIIQQTQQLTERQEQQDDPEILPKVGLEDVAEKLLIPHVETGKIHSFKTSWYPSPTNGLTYQSLVIDLPQMDPDLLEYLPLYASCITELGCGKLDYLQIQNRQTAVTGGISASCSIRSDINDKNKMKGVFIVSSKSLNRNFEAMSELILQTTLATRFDELPRLRELIAQTRVAEENSITGNGHGLAMTAASAGFSPVSTQNNIWHGPISIQVIKQWDDALDQQPALEKLAQQFIKIQSLLAQSPKQFLLIGEAGNETVLHNTLEKQWQPTNDISAFSKLVLPTHTGSDKTAWATNTQVNFCAKAFAAVPAGHPDAAVFSVLSNFLRNGFLHTAIREKGGAYGGGASYCRDSSAFRFYSYRDPRLKETLDDFDQSIAWLLNTQHKDDALEEAILGIISNIDKPSSPAGNASQAFYSELHGRTAEHRKKVRQQVLKVTIDDLQRIGKNYLQNQPCNTVVIGNRQNLDALEKDGFEIKTI